MVKLCIAHEESLKILNFSNITEWHNQLAVGEGGRLSVIFDFRTGASEGEGRMESN